MADPVVLHYESFSWANGVGPYQGIYPLYLSDPFANLQMGFVGGMPSPFGRGGRGCIRGNSGGSVGKIITPGTTRGMSIAANHYGAGYGLTLCELREGTTVHIGIYTNSAGKIEAWRGGAGTPLQTSTPTFVGSGFGHVEVCGTVHDSTGAIEVRVDGIPWITLSGADTRNGGTGVIDNVNIAVNAGRVLCDWIIHDGTGFLGDKIVDYFEANVAGTYTAATASSGTLLSCIDEVALDYADYIIQTNAALPKKVSFGVRNAPGNATRILNVMPMVIGAKTDAGPNIGRLLLISGATESDGGVDIAPTTSGYPIAPRMHAVDPNTGVEMTPANFNNIEVGWLRSA